MGLDLILYRESEETLKALDPFVNNELCYGRKTWAIANFFACRSEQIDEYNFIVPEFAWDEFIRRVKPYANDQAFVNIVNTEEELSEEDYAAVERIVDKLLDNDDPCQLGYLWEAQIMLEWYNCDYIVKEAYAEGYTVKMLMSY